MILSFLTGINDVSVTYDVLRTLHTHFAFDTKTLADIMQALLGWIGK